MLKPAPKGWAGFAWQADYAQFYLVDRGEGDWAPPVEITDRMLEDSFAVPATGLVVYTQDCLYQQIRIAIYDREPAHADREPIGGKPWTRVRETVARFPARAFSLSSPSMPDPLPNGPIFLLDSGETKVRVSWMEFQGVRDDSVPVEPDVIEIEMWPADVG